MKHALFAPVNIASLVFFRVLFGASLNGCEYQQLIDPGIDLSTVPRPVFGPGSWIVPLQTPLSQGTQSEAGEIEE